GLSGVSEVGVGRSTPLKASSTSFEVKEEGKSVKVGEATPRADFRTAAPEYFSAAGIPLIKGRAFLATDGIGAGKVVIINRTLADKVFPGEDPIGKRIAWTGEVLKFSPISPEWRTIVGVVGNTQDGGMDAPLRPVVVMAVAHELAMSGVIVVRTDADAASLAPTVTRIIHRVAPA